MEEDDGQIARELVPVAEAFVKKGSDNENSLATLGLEQKGLQSALILSSILMNRIALMMLVIICNREEHPGGGG